MKIYIVVGLSLLLACCTSTDKSEIHQGKRDKVVNVKGRLKEIIGDDVILSGRSRSYPVNDYLLFEDPKSPDTIYHIFNKHTFQHIKSLGVRGQGPNEITNPSRMAVDEKSNNFLIPDLGKRKIVRYQIDSAINVSNYLPELGATMGNMQFPDRFVYFSDTLCLARVITKPSNPREYFKHSIAFWNMVTGNLSFLPYSHPEIERKRVVFGASMEDNVIVEAYRHHDLITIHDFKGNFKCNIYGSHWDNATKNDMIYFTNVMIDRGKIFISYAGGRNWMDEQWATKIMVFDTDGNYISTLDVGYKIIHCSLDKDNQRIIFTLDGDMLFAYLDLKDLV